jgi:hypothetical protein
MPGTEPRDGVGCIRKADGVEALAAAVALDDGGGGGFAGTVSVEGIAKEAEVPMEDADMLRAGLAGRLAAAATANAVEIDGCRGSDGAAVLTGVTDGVDCWEGTCVLRGVACADGCCDTGADEGWTAFP